MADSIFDAQGISKALSSVFGQQVVTPAGTISTQQQAQVANPAAPNGTPAEAPIVQAGIRTATGVDGARPQPMLWLACAGVILVGAYFLLRK